MPLTGHLFEPMVHWVPSRAGIGCKYVLTYRTESGTYPDNPSPLGTELMRYLLALLRLPGGLIDKATTQHKSYILLDLDRTG